MGLLKVCPLAIGVFSLLLNFYKLNCAVDVNVKPNASLEEVDATEKNVTTSAFLNFGQRTIGDQRYWYEHLYDDADRTLKSKADILSRLLKMHIDRLRNQTDQVKRQNACEHSMLAFFFFSFFLSRKMHVYKTSEDNGMISSNLVS